MGARVAKQRAAARSAKKRKSASPAVANQTTARDAPPPVVNEEKAGALTRDLPSGPVLSQEKVQSTSRRTRRTNKTPVKEVEQDPAELVPDHGVDVVPSQSILPERSARQGFTALLAKIVEEEPEIEEADRSIGNYEFHDEEWDSWKAGPVEFEDEFEDDVCDDSNSESDETRSIMSLMSATRTKGSRTLTKPRSRHASSTKKPKAGGKKRKHKDPSPDLDSDSDGGSEPQRERLMRAKLAYTNDTFFGEQILRTKLMSPARQETSESCSRYQVISSGKNWNRKLPKY